MPVVLETNFAGLRLVKQGKVRDMYDLGSELLIVATDRLSAFDVVMPQGIPDKGKVLTRISAFWFEQTRHLIPNHVVATNVDEFPEACRPYADILKDRSMVVKRSEPLSVECIVRGYLSGSGWEEYKRSGRVCGIALPAGLVESSRLPEPIFTPSTKADLGVHDENISFDEMVKREGAEVSSQVRDAAIAIYKHASQCAEAKGIIIADTKMEFGMLDGRLILIDEVLTPDSSRFWPLSQYEAGRGQASFDKQYVRDYLISIGFQKRPPGPMMPEEVIEKTAGLYRSALTILTGETLE